MKMKISRLFFLFFAVLISACVQQNSSSSTNESSTTEIDTVATKKEHELIQQQLPPSKPQKGLRALAQAYFIYYECAALWRDAYRLHVLHSTDFWTSMNEEQRVLDTLKTLRFTDDSLQIYSDRFLNLIQDRILLLHKCYGEKRDISDAEMNDALMDSCCSALILYSIHHYGPKGSLAMPLLADDSLYNRQSVRQRAIKLLGAPKDTYEAEFNRLCKIIDEGKNKAVIPYAILKAGDLLEYHDNAIAGDDISASETMYYSGLVVPYYHPFLFDLWQNWSLVYQKNWGGQSASSRSCALVRDRMRYQIELKIITYIEQHPQDIYSTAQFYNLLFYNPETGQWPYRKMKYES